MDEEVGAATMAMGQDSQGEVNVEDHHVADASAAVAVDPRCDAEVVAAGLDREEGLARAVERLREA
ncbi:hypothetical protein GCM10010441_62790 [Kitasatospora paracochleata]|uniref:Uncharacterized protein n=1 Tax=Kitasatospora paracochleata TaxID=58354 RepID=A0ABT1J332_9ACTN|nr:hypothetical protein [Kitasatospora paracochleata]